MTDPDVCVISSSDAKLTPTTNLLAGQLPFLIVVAGFGALDPDQAVKVWLVFAQVPVALI
jgi:hypothetical protein